MSTVTKETEEIVQQSTDKEIRIVAFLIHLGCATSNWSFVKGFLTSSWKQNIFTGLAVKNQKIATPLVSV